MNVALTSAPPPLPLLREGVAARIADSTAALSVRSHSAIKDWAIALEYTLPSAPNVNVIGCPAAAITFAFTSVNDSPTTLCP
jgi:hypothetical protein